jgi:ferredoxin
VGEGRRHRTKDIPIHNYLVPKEFTHEDGRLTGVVFEKVKAEYGKDGRRKLVPTGEPDVHMPCDDVLVAVGQENAFPWIERDLGIEFDQLGHAGGRSRHLSIDQPEGVLRRRCGVRPQEHHLGGGAWARSRGVDRPACATAKSVNAERPRPLTNLLSQKMGIHEWSYDNDVSLDQRYKVPHAPKAVTLKNVNVEVELGFDPERAFLEAQRCLNCDIETVFERGLCIECDACVDICPMDCITFTENGEEEELRTRLTAPAVNPEQDLYVSDTLKTGRVMVKDEDVCLHCGLCAERCPTGAWDMKKFYLETGAGGIMPGTRLSRRRTISSSSSPTSTAPVRPVANELFARSILRMGVPVASRNIFPSNIQGLPTWYEVRDFRRRLAWPARRCGPDGGDEPADLGQGRRLDRAGWLSAVRFDQAAAAVRNSVRM